MERQVAEQNQHQPWSTSLVLAGGGCGYRGHVMVVWTGPPSLNHHAQELGVQHGGEENKIIITTKWWWGNKIITTTKCWWGK